MNALTFALALSLPPIPDFAEPAYRLAPMEVREAIDEAYSAADPRRRNPWWRAELYMICARESRCGRDGRVGVHGNDAPRTQRLAFDRAHARGLLDAECQEHAWIEGEWGTRGLFGMIAAYSVGRLGCEGPWVLDDAEVAATLAVQRLASCDAWTGSGSIRRRVACTCIDHTRLWVGAGTWRARPLLGKSSRLASVARQCGPGVAGWMFVIETGWFF